MTITLNFEQKRAVEYNKGPLLIIAGAGTGKTTVITERIKWLITKKNIPPSQILALTFTNKAASEMEERVDLALPLGYSNMRISTFHSFGDQILRDEAVNIGLDPNFKLLSQAESILFLQRYLFKLKLDYFRPASNPTKFLNALLIHFSRLADEDISPKEYLIFAKKQSKKADTKEEKLEAKKTLELANSFSQYQTLKEKEGAMDFGDLIRNTLTLFRKRPNLLKNYQDKFKHVLVDEFQDTNIAQYELIKLLAHPTPQAKLTVTGDDSQSIYKFRGAAISNIITFMKDYPKAKKVVLTQNYRSTQTILDHAYKLIKHNDPDTLEARLGISKNLKSNRKIKGKPIELIFTERGEEEADQVAQEIKRLTIDEKCQYRDFAILLRANSHAESFIRALARHNLPYQFLGPGQLFRKPEIKDLIAYLKLLNDPLDDIAAFRLSSLSFFGIPMRDLAFIKSFSKRNNLSFFESFEEIAKEKTKFTLPRLAKKSKNKIKKLMKMIHRHLKLVSRESGGQILYFFLQDTKLLKKYLDPKSEKQQLAALNIAKFFDKIKGFEIQNKETAVTSLLDWINLRMEMGESPLASEIDWSEHNAINLLTIHSAKGLEFPVVFLVNLVNRRFPTDRRSEPIPIPQPLIKEILPEGDAHLQEERRLFYVALTRAKDRLFLTGAKIYPEGKLQKKLSVFVAETLGKTTTSPTPTNQQLSLVDWQKTLNPKPLPPIFNPPVNYLSFSQIDAFDICPQQYKYKQVLRIPTPPSPSQTLGNIIHQTLKVFYQKQLKSKKKLTLNSLLKLLEQNWSSQGFSSKSEEQKARQNAKRMMKNFYKKGFNYKKIGQTIALEQPFNFKLTPSLKIGGVIDRVDNLKNNQIEIIDYKTGSRIPKQKDVDGNDQLTLYALAASSIKDLPFYRSLPKITLSLYFLDKGIKISSQRTEKQIKRMKDKIIKLVKQLKTTNFPPKPNRPFPCNYCEYKLLCDAWR